MIKKMIINGLTFEGLKPIRRSFRNKNNKFSALGFLDKKKIKIYEVFDKNQGPLREFISKNKKISKYFPNLITYNKKFIVEDWIKGKTLKELSITSKKNYQSDEVKHIINLMWSLKYDEQAFDYLRYIHKRVNKKYNLDLNSLPIRINHNDLSLDNIIQTSKELKIIDNEFLGCNTGWILNIKNSFLKEDFVYQNYLSSKKLNDLWVVRKEWSRIKSKNLLNKNWKINNFFRKFL